MTKDNEFLKYESLETRVESGDRSDNLLAEIEDFEDYALDNDIWALYDRLEILKSNFPTHLFQGWNL